MDIEKICNEVLDELNLCYDIEMSLRNSFITVIKYLNQFPENLSVRSKNNIPDVKTKEGIEQLAVSYFNGFYSPTVPKLPQTVPDEMVSFIMEIVFNHSKKETEEIKITHLESMASENAVGALLERYLDSVLREKGWAWCCGNFVKATTTGKMNDNSLGRINDIGMKAGSILIATYLASKAKTKTEGVVQGFELIDINKKDYDSYYKVANLLTDLDKKDEAADMLNKLLKR